MRSYNKGFLVFNLPKILLVNHYQNICISTYTCEIFTETYRFEKNLDKLIMEKWQWEQAVKQIGYTDSHEEVTSLFGESDPDYRFYK